MRNRFVYVQPSFVKKRCRRFVAIGYDHAVSLKTEHVGGTQGEQQAVGLAQKSGGLPVRLVQAAERDVAVGVRQTAVVLPAMPEAGVLRQFIGRKRSVAHQQAFEASGDRYRIVHDTEWIDQGVELCSGQPGANIFRKTGAQEQQLVGM